MAVSCRKLVNSFSLHGKFTGGPQARLREREKTRIDSFVIEGNVRLVERDEFFLNVKIKRNVATIVVID